MRRAELAAGAEADPQVVLLQHDRGQAEVVVACDVDRADVGPSSRPDEVGEGQEPIVGIAEVDPVREALDRARRTQWGSASGTDRSALGAPPAPPLRPPSQPVRARPTVSSGAALRPGLREG